MSSYNHSSSYNRTYERQVIEEGIPTSIHRMHTSSPIHAIKSTLSGFPTGASSSFVQPHNYHFGTATSGSFHTSDDSFSAVLDVSAFAPEELKVSVVGNQIVIEGKHPEKTDDLGSIERHFIRKFVLPRNVPAEAVSSNLAEGRLTISGEAPKHKENSPARTIPIKIVNQPANPGAAANGQPAANPQQNGSQQ
ncbi:hsp20/alpha crystallin family domain-containing protein [Ditylenchus destructor]|uniref:Hsp20/alpha crystallin family domain-containing protein n=1 Tax=Ditylenchus destructor TaxID=166010 RepID=A0AAD4NGK0_9BILA|nr:hsp20/alpha crystallin family domain-containing protein [Ditylenchus destructor]